MASNNLRNMLGAGIPAEIKLAHKHGFVAASWGDTRAEVASSFRRKLPIWSASTSGRTSTGSTLGSSNRSTVT